LIESTQLIVGRFRENIMSVRPDPREAPHVLSDNEDDDNIPTGIEREESREVTASSPDFGEGTANPPDFSTFSDLPRLLFVLSSRLVYCPSNGEEFRQWFDQMIKFDHVGAIEREEELFQVAFVPKPMLKACMQNSGLTHSQITSVLDLLDLEPIFPVSHTNSTNSTDLTKSNQLEPILTDSTNSTNSYHLESD
jgi:hypothetical protein